MHHLYLKRLTWLLVFNVLSKTQQAVTKGAAIKGDGCPEAHLEVTAEPFTTQPALKLQNHIVRLDLTIKGEPASLTIGQGQRSPDEVQPTQHAQNQIERHERS